MKARVFMFFICFLGFAAKNTMAGELVSVKSSKNLMFVLYGKSEAKNLQPGSRVAVQTQTGTELRGTVVGKGEWFHKIMAKIRMEK